MKKLVSLILSVVMVLSMTIAASAAFVSSPSGNAAPTLEKVTGENSDGLEIEITSYKDRDALTAEAKAALEDSYNDIKNASSLSDLTKEIESAAKKAGAKVSDLAVSDLFDISVTEGDLNGKITIVLKAETLKNFVALLHNKDGEWDVVDGASIKGNKLTFSVSELSPFAIVVSSSEVNSPITGSTVDYGMIFVVCAVVFGAVSALLIVKSKKRAND